jgi:hypothetical protein
MTTRELERRARATTRGNTQLPRHEWESVARILARVLASLLLQADQSANADEPKRRRAG